MIPLNKPKKKKAFSSFSPLAKSGPIYLKDCGV
jgi:hypothetical protein